jgi:hypothetical protein
MFGATGEVTEEVKTAVDQINKYAKTESSIIIRGGSNLPAETRRNNLYESRRWRKTSSMRPEKENINIDFCGYFYRK